MHVAFLCHCWPQKTRTAKDKVAGAEDEVEACRVLLPRITVGARVWLVSLPTTR